MNGVLNTAFTRPRTILVGLITILIAGAMSYAGISKEAEPDVSIPTIYVSMVHQGISPEDAVRLLIKPMEQELRSLEGLKEMTSTAAEGYGSIKLEFESGFDPDEAIDDVRVKVDLARPELPEETEEPTIQEINIALLPMMVVNLYGDVSERTLVSIARDLKDRLESITEVLEAEVAGDRDEMIEINIDPVRLETYNLSMEAVLNAVQRNNQLVAAGSVSTGSGRFSIKVPGIIDNVDKLLNLAIKEANNEVVKVSDVATVRRTYVDPEGYARLNGKRTVALEVSKRLGANIIETSARVREVVAQTSKAWPGAVQVNYSQDKSIDTQRNLDDLQNNVLSGVVLVMIVVVAFLGLRAGTLVGVSIPGSFLLGIMVIGAMGLTINMVVLFGLILALGLLVDSTIIIVELADRYQAEGQGRTSAYMHAAQRMAWPVIASTSTTLAAFVPLIFWPGVMGDFMSYLPITLICVLSASLLMALLFIPNLGAVIGGTPPAGGKPAWRPGEPLSGWTGRYVGLLQSVLPHAGKVLLFALTALVGTFMLYSAVGKGVEFFPEVNMDNAVVKVHARGALSAQETDRLVSEVEALLADIDGVESIYTRSGVAFRRGDNKEDTIGIIQVRFKDWQHRPHAREMLATIRERIGNPAGLDVEVLEPQAGPQEGKPVQVEIYGPSIDELDEAVTWLRKGMQQVGGFVDVTDTLPHPGLEWRIEIDRAEAARYGADIATVGQFIQLLTQGIKVGEYRAPDAADEMDIRVRLSEEYRDLDKLSRLRVNTTTGQTPIANFVERIPAQKVASISRIDGHRAVKVESYVEDGLVVATQLQKLGEWVKANYEQADLHPSLHIAFKGEDEDIREAEAFLSKAFLVALAMIAVILLTQFNSFYQSFLILTAIVFSTIGVLIGLMVTGQPFGVIMSGIGVISLAGIVVNNNIVLIDTYNLLRDEGLNAIDAVLQTGAERLRPVLLTTVTTVLGLMPMVMKMNVDLFARDITFGAPSTQYWAQLASAIVGGLIFATMLTLVLTPCLLVLGERMNRRLGLRRRKVHQATVEELEEA
mgnify:CR=1 FL=1